MDFPQKVFPFSTYSSGYLPYNESEIERFLKYVRNQRNLNTLKISKDYTLAVEFSLKYLFSTSIKVLQKYRNFLIFEKPKI